MCLTQVLKIRWGQKLWIRKIYLLLLWQLSHTQWAIFFFSRGRIYLFIYKRISAVYECIYFIPQSLKGPRII